MAINILVFEVNELEKNYFDNNAFDGYNITLFEECLNEEFVNTLTEDQLANTNVISVDKDSVVSEAVLERFTNVRILTVRSDYYDQICINKCEERNIAVINIPEANTKTAAQYVIGLIISLTRNIIPANKMIRGTKEFKQELIGRDASKLKLGIIGTGHVGGEICRIADAIGMEVYACDVCPRCELIEKFNVNYMPINELAQIVDVISVNAIYTSKNYHLLNEEIFQKCKDGVYIVSISKSELIDYEALYKYVENGKIKGVALDAVPCLDICYHCKNLSNNLIPSPLTCLEQTNYYEKFKNYENVIITPCLAFETTDSSTYILDTTMRYIKEILNGERMYRIV